MSDPQPPKIMSDPQMDLDEMFRDLGSATGKEALQIRLKTSDKDELATLHRYIANQTGLTDSLLTAGWITPEQKQDIVFVADTLRKSGYGPYRLGGKRRYSTRSKKYKKSNKRSKRTRTLRRKRYSRKS